MTEDDKRLIAETQRRLDAFHSPSFDRETVEALLSLIRSAEERAEKLAGAVETAYGILWRDVGDRSVEKSVAARKTLFAVITKDGQQRGIQQALATYGPVPESEVLSIEDEKNEPTAGLAAEMDKLWRMFVVQCESIEDKENREPDNEHEKGFYAGEKHAAKRIRRSVEHPKYNAADFPAYRAALDTADANSRASSILTSARNAVGDSNG